jgi:hypothetical protein
MRVIKDLRVEVFQYKAKIESAVKPNCVGQIKVYKDDSLIDSIFYDEIGAVGGQFGLLVYPRTIKNHIVITKYGDYSGQTIIIDENGACYKTIGGFSFYDKESGLLFSILHSDVSGLSVFDLNSDTEIFKIVDIEDRPQEFYKNDQDRFFYRAINDETGAESIWEIEFDLERIMHTDLQLTNVMLQRIDSLIDYQTINVGCE